MPNLVDEIYSAHHLNMNNFFGEFSGRSHFKGRSSALEINYARKRQITTIARRVIESRTRAAIFTFSQ